MLLIRSAVAGDVPLLNMLIHEFAEFYSFPVSITEQDLVRDGFGSQPKFRVLIAEWAGEPAGYALFFDYYSSFHGRALFLEDLFIRSQFRGKSVGKALLARVAAIAREDGPFGVIFNVLDWNRPAIEFYKRLSATFWDNHKTVCLQGNALQALAGSVGKDP